MALNGISTLPTKAARTIAKISIATDKRQLSGTNGFRVLNDYIGSVSPTIGRPWGADPLVVDGGSSTATFASIINGGNANSTGGVGNQLDGGNSLTVF